MSTASDVPVEQPTNVRWLIFALACGTSWFLYLHRYAWNIIGPKLQETYQFDNTQSGFVFSLFYWTYAAGQVPCGIVIDLFGPHLFLGCSILLWSCALAGFGLTNNLAMIGALRLIFGTAQAGCYPGLMKVTRIWFPVSMRTTMQGWVATTFGRAGGAMSSIILGTVLMGWCQMDWQTSLIVMSLGGAVFGIAFLILFRNTPEEHSLVNDAERTLLAGGSVTQSQHGVLPFRRAIRSRSLFCFVIQQYLDAGSDVAFVYLMGKYFLDRHHLQIEDVGWLTSLPLWGGALGGIAGGWLNDRLIRATGNRRWSRSGIGFVGKMIGCVLLLAVNEQSIPVTAGILLMFAKFFSDWSQPTVWGTCTDLGGRCSATVFSIINTFGTIGGIIMPIVLGRLLDANTTKVITDGAATVTTNWGPLYVVLAGMYFASGIFWLLIDCTKSLDLPNEANASGR